MKTAYWWLGVLAVVLLALFLRLHGIHDPLLDHPGWRQGDTAAIARNFARLRFDIMYPQTLYNGPPPNYVELELQIVPFLAAGLYRIFGIHEVFGRLVALGFSLGTVVMLACFGRWLFRSTVAGWLGAFFFAVFPGSVYYGRTFMPDGVMLFFLTAALYAAARYFVEDERQSLRGAAAAAGLLALAYLAKPVSALALAPLTGLLITRARAGRTLRALPLAIVFAAPLLVLYLYDRRVASYAEWHWASGIAQLHVFPALRAAASTPAGFAAKLDAFWFALGLLRATMLGAVACVLALAAFAGLGWLPARSKALLWYWLAGGLAYVYVVVAVERVDYYLLPLLPLCALVMGGAGAALAALIRNADLAPAGRYALLAVVAILMLAVLAGSRAPVAAYYRYNRQAYRYAIQLDRTLPKNALIVIGHYGPDVQYYIDRFGWEEDPAIWTPFDEESAIAKGARYFISIEDNRLRSNLELCAWMQRFPRIERGDTWPVYLTDPARVLPAADRLWRDFRRAERSGNGGGFLNARGLCRQSAG
jgi:hypothetical protein